MKIKLIILSTLVLLGLCLVPAMGMEIERQKNVATIISFPIVDGAGDVVINEDDAGLDSELDNWNDGAAPNGFTDATNEGVETQDGVSGWYYLSLTQAEMNYDYISVHVKTTTAGVVDPKLLIITRVGDPLNIATTDDGTTINVASGVVEANMTQIGGNSVAGNAATLTLKQLNIQNNAGSALVAISTGSNGHGMEIAGEGTGEGLRTTGGSTGHGIQALGGSTSGDGIHAAAATEGDGIYALAKGTDEHGIFAVGGDTSGNGFYATAITEGDGIYAAGKGTNQHGIYALGGDTSGDGIHAVAATEGDGIYTHGQGTSQHGIYAIGGDTSGNGITATATTEGDGIYAAGKGTGEHGIYAIGGDTSGDGIHTAAIAGNGNGLTAVKHGTGKDIEADISGTITTVTTATTCSDVTNLGGTAAATQINNQVIDVISTDTYAEIAAGAPSATPTFAYMMTALYQYLLRNKIIQVGAGASAVQTLYGDDGTTPVFEIDVADDGTTMTKSEATAP